MSRTTSLPAAPATTFAAVLVAALAGALLLAGAPPAAGAADPAVDPALVDALEYRLIGPYRGGRSTAVAGVVQDRRTFYMGTTGGGLWKTSDGGESWLNVSDPGEDEESVFGVGSIGAVAVAPSDPNVVWVGTGSACPRGNVSPGDGVYRSTDGGESWSRAGLPEAGQIGRVRVHPNDPDTAWVAALGHAFGPNPERGVFKTTDGGATWQKVLFVSETAGAVDLALHPGNPRILYASIWPVVRRPWEMVSGSEEGGLWRSADGGRTWKELGEDQGLPEGIVGRIGVTVSPADSQRVWALVEHEDGGLFRSDDGGATFTRVNDERKLRQRAWYYTHVVADTEDPNTVYVLNVQFHRSVDGGKTFDSISVPHGDNHDLWIHPEDADVMIEANDGGANVSYNAGASWSTQANQPTAEIYRLTVDDGFPYRVYGSQQDNSTLSLPSRTIGAGIGRDDWYPVGGCESGHIAVDPRDRNLVYAGCYGGSITRYDHATGLEREILTYPQLALGQAPRDLRYRFQWNAPIRISPHDPSVLYHASQFVHRSTDEGQSWEVVSPDLSRDDESKQGKSGGRITSDDTGVEIYSTIFALEESPHAPGELWAGSDDGLVHIRRGPDADWQEITPAAMPEWATVNTIELSPHAPGRAFLAVQRYRLDDFAPYVFRTDDHGATWSPLTDGANGIPADHFVRVVREDPERRGLLYAGTEFGVYVSFDDGRRWQPLQANLPVTPVTDMAVKHGDLVVSTQGRSFWILDDLSPLRQMSAEVSAARAWLFAPRPALRMDGVQVDRPRLGENPPAGAIIQYVLAEDLTPPEKEGEENEGDDEGGDGTEGEDQDAADPPPPADAAGEAASATPDQPDDQPDELLLEILDPAGEVVQTFSNLEEADRAPDPWADFLGSGAGDTKLPAEKGLNRFVWDLRHPDPTTAEGVIFWGRPRGPLPVPGTYTVRLTLGDLAQERPLEIRLDPRLEATTEELQEQFDLAMKVRDLLSANQQAVTTLRAVRDQVEGVVSRVEKADLPEETATPIEEKADTITEALTTLESRLTQPQAKASQDILNFPPMLDNQILTLYGAVASGHHRPTTGSQERYGDLKAEMNALQAELDTVLEEELPAFEALVREAEVPAVVVPQRAESQTSAQLGT